MSASLAERRWRLAVRLVGAAAVWALGLLLAAVLVPAYNAESVSPADGVTLTRVTLVQSRGVWALVVVTVPLVASAAVAVSMAVRRRRAARWSEPAGWTAIGVVAIVALLAITSVGAFLVPVLVLLALSVRLAPGWGDVRVHPVRA